MNKNSFKENTRYTITYRDETGKLRPENIYVFKLHDEYMIARFTDRSAELCKIPYQNVIKIVKTIEVPPSAQFMVPSELLSKQNWQDKTCMKVYGSSPRVGK